MMAYLDSGTLDVDGNLWFFYMQEHAYILKIKCKKSDTKLYLDASIYVVFKQRNWNYLLKHRFIDHITVKENTEVMIVNFRVTAVSMRGQWHVDW